MNSWQASLSRAAFFLAFGSAVAVIFSIAACNVLLVLAFAALLMSGEKLRFPPIKLPLALFFAGTVISLLLSQDPAAGRPQIRKFFVFLMLLVVTSAIHRVEDVRWLVLAWTGAAVLSSLLGFVQFAHKWQAAHALGRSFYQYYVPERITGFMSHWMTYGGELMIVLMMLGAFLLFARTDRRELWVGWGAAALIALALLLGWTRGVWLGTAAGAVYLLWHWKRWVIAAIPAAVAILLLIPGPTRERLTSALKPHGEVDSNEHRIVTWRTGWQMIKAHPWFGIGPEHVKLHFNDYIPPDVPRPLPEGWYGHLHNIYLQYAAERGIPTMLAMMWMLGKILLDFILGLRRHGREPSDGRFILLGSVAVLIAVLVEGVFEFNLGDSEVLLLFLAVVSCGYAALEKQKAPNA